MSEKEWELSEADRDNWVNKEMGTARDDRGKGSSQPSNRSCDAVPSTEERAKNARLDYESFMDAHAVVDHPPHYTSHPSGIECIDVVEHMNFCLGNAIKYIWRADLKNGVEDLKKARWYLDHEIARRNKKDD